VPLTQSSLEVRSTYALTRTNTGFGDTKVGPKTRTYTLQPAVATFNQLYAARLVLAAAASQTVDFSAITNLAQEAATLTKAVTLELYPSGTDAAVKIEPGAADPLTWFFSGTTPAITIPTGGVFVFAQPLAQVVSGAAKNLKFTNTGSGTLTLDVILRGGT
jgi:hypothetical protein